MGIIENNMFNLQGAMDSVLWVWKAMASVNNLYSQACSLELKVTSDMFPFLPGRQLAFWGLLIIVLQLMLSLSCVHILWSIFLKSLHWIQIA